MRAAEYRQAFPWDQVIAFVLGVLRLPPRDFWSLTLPELALLVAAAAPGSEPIARSAFSSLMTRFPDKDI